MKKSVKEQIREVLDKDANYVNDKTLDCLVNNITKILKDMECMKKEDIFGFEHFESLENKMIGKNNHITEFWKEWEGKGER